MLHKWYLRSPGGRETGARGSRGRWPGALAGGGCGLGGTAVDAGNGSFETSLGPAAAPTQLGKYLPGVGTQGNLILEALGQRSGGAAELLSVSLPDALRDLPQHAVDEATARDLRAGKRVAWEAAVGGSTGSTEPRVCLLDPAGNLIAVAEPRPDGLVKTLRVFGASPRAEAAKKPS